MSPEERRRKIIMGAVLAIAGIVVAYLMFFKGAGVEEPIEADTALPVPEQTVEADRQTDEAVKVLAAANTQTLEKQLRAAAKKAAAKVAQAKPSDDGKLEATVQVKADQLFVLLAAIDGKAGFRQGGQLRASGPAALVDSLSASPQGSGLELKLTLRSP